MKYLNLIHFSFIDFEIPCRCIVLSGITSSIITSFRIETTLSGLILKNTIFCMNSTITKTVVYFLYGDKFLFESDGHHISVTLKLPEIGKNKVIFQYNVGGFFGFMNYSSSEKGILNLELD